MKLFKSRVQAGTSALAKGRGRREVYAAMTRDEAQWSTGKRVGFLFLAIELGLHAALELAGAIPVAGELVRELWATLWAALMPTLGNAALGIAAPIEVIETGSGDMTWHFVQELWYVTLSAVGAVVWAVVDRRRPDYRRHAAWLRVLVRYALATAMFNYGFAKLTGNQFTAPDAMRLSETYGDSSPMGLVWTFMGFSGAYCAFTGLSELLAAW